MSLSRLYIIRESSLGNIKRLLGFSQPVAEWFHTEQPNNSFTIAKLVALLNPDDSSLRVEGEFDVWNIENLIELIPQYLNVSESELKALLSDVKFVKAINSAKNLDQVRDAVTQIKPKKKPHNPNDVFMELDSGWFWLNLRKSICYDEAGAMSHCGSDDRGTLYSLRDAENNPHVTMTYNEDKNELWQISGKGNAVPNRKYWSAIMAFFEKTNASLKDKKTIASELGTELSKFVPEAKPKKVEVIKKVNSEEIWIKAPDEEHDVFQLVHPSDNVETFGDEGYPEVQIIDTGWGGRRLVIVEPGASPFAVNALLTALRIDEPDLELYDD